MCLFLGNGIMINIKVGLNFLRNMDKLILIGQIVIGLLVDCCYMNMIGYIF